MKTGNVYKKGHLELDGFKTPFVVYSSVKELLKERLLEEKIIKLKQSLIDKLNN